MADVQAVGLMKNMAILEVNGERFTIKAGQERNGVKLISSNSREAMVEINGRSEVLPLGASIVSSYAAPKSKEIRIPRARNGQYFVPVTVNGRTVEMLVDTGATTVAMSSSVARRLGIDYTKGTKSRSATAGGIVPSYSFKLDSVKVGGIKRYGVRASVIEGNHPLYPLLGMSFLNHLKISDENGMMVLSDK